MKIAIAGGHSAVAHGAVGIIDEYAKDRAYVARLVPALEAAGHDVVNCSNESTSVNGELAEECRIANASGADVFMAVHFNSGGGTGTECYHYPGNDGMRNLSERMSANVASALGLRDRGAKDANFYVLRNTNMPAILLEVCFVDTQQDADAWHAAPWDDLTAAVVNAFGGASFEGGSSDDGGSEPEQSPCGYADCTWLQRIVGADPDNVWGPDTGKRVGAVQMASNYHGIKFPYGVAFAQGVVGADPDGVWGAKSRAAHDETVKAIQAGFGIEVDGILGQDTDSHIHELHMASNHTA